MTEHKGEAPPTTWIEVRDPSSKRLLFKFDPQRLLVEAMCGYWDQAKGKRIKYPVCVDLGLYLTGKSETTT